MPSPTSDFLAQFGPSTAQVYGHTLAEFASLSGYGPERASQDDVLAYQATITDQAPATTSRKLATLSSFYRYLQRRGVRDDNPMAAIRIERYRVDPARSVRYLTPEEVTDLVAAAEDDRERAVLAVLLHGLRLSELVALNVEQYREGSLMGVEGKGGRVRHVPLNPTALPILERYLGRRRSGPFFLSRTKQRIQRRAVQDIVYRVSQRAGKRISAHSLRHTFATTLIRDRAGLETVQDLLGHASPVTTRIYARLDLSTLREAVESAPLLGAVSLRAIGGEMPSARVPDKEARPVGAR
jgi:site-specific recombinase XerD